MSDNDTRRARDRATRDAAGHLVVSVAEDLARPLDEIRELLASLVDTLDTHVATATGPVALSYVESKRVREEVAEAYLKSESAARLARELASAVKPDGAIETALLGEIVEAALLLAHSRFAADTELFIDLGSIPPVAVVVSQAVLAIARVLVFCADSTAAAEDAAVSIRTRARAGEVVLRISENGRGAGSDEIATACALCEALAARVGGHLSATSELGAGSTFELRLPASG